VQAEEFFFTANGHRLAATKLVPAGLAEPGILALHGLGPTATRHRIRYLLDPLADRGYGSVTFDFSGNGDSTGVLAESTLLGRRAEALAAAGTLARGTAPVVIGTSMGAHLAAWTAPDTGPRGLVLFCPAAYPEGAAEQKFDGSLARPGRYDDSPAYAGLRGFTGDLLIIASKHDQVVPPAVIDGYLASASAARSAEVIWLDGGDHFVHRWLPDHEALQAEIVQAIAALLDRDHELSPRR
jgi:uncharacterized protein